MAGFDVPWTEILNFFELRTLIFCSFLDNVEIIVNKICFWKEKYGSPNVQYLYIQVKLQQWPSYLSLFILILSACALIDDVV